MKKKQGNSGVERTKEPTVTNTKQFHTHKKCCNLSLKTDGKKEGKPNAAFGPSQRGNRNKKSLSNKIRTKTKWEHVPNRANTKTKNKNA